MAFKNFKVETDADGIVLATWDTPGRSMNVLDETSINELEAIVKQTSADGAVKGVVEPYQATAFLMAVYFNGMTARETSVMTASMSSLSSGSSIAEVSPLAIAIARNVLFTSERNFIP